MGKAIVYGTVIVIVTTMVLWLIWRGLKESNEVGDLNLKQERELRRLVDDAALTMRTLGSSFTVEDSDVLSPRSRTSLDDWLKRYDRFIQKEINA